MSHSVSALVCSDWAHDCRPSPPARVTSTHWLPVLWDIQQTSKVPGLDLWVDSCSSSFHLAMFPQKKQKSSSNSSKVENITAALQPGAENMSNGMFTWNKMVRLKEIRHNFLGSNVTAHTEPLQCYAEAPMLPQPTTDLHSCDSPLLQATADPNL